MLNKKIIIATSLIILPTTLFLYKEHKRMSNLQQNSIVQVQTQNKKNKVVYKTKKDKSLAEKNVSLAEKTVMKSNLLSPSYRMLNGKKVVDWEKSTGPHPDLSNISADQLKIVVNKKSQTLTVYNQDKPVTEFLISTGKHTTETETPSGTFAIQEEHGNWFYSPKKGVEEGAKNWVSFKDHGVYLFHSVVFDKNQNLIMSRQGKLGHPNSHGCVQLSVPDSQWFFNTFANKVGTQVVVK